MKITCSQMDVLISFYIEGELSSSLKEQVEKHLKECSVCRAKYDIIKTMLKEIQNNYNKGKDILIEKSDGNISNKNSYQYKLFKTNLSAYLDNELSNDDNIKVKKFTINNRQARKELEDSYQIRKLMNNSFKKAKFNAKNDFSKSVIKNLELDEDFSFGMHPAVKLIIAFVSVVFLITSIVLISLTV